MFRTFAVLSAITLGSVTFAGASIVTPGQSTTPDSLNPNGTKLVETSGTLTAYFASTGKLDYTVNYTVGVYQDASSQVCAGCLDFYYVFTNNGPGAIERFSASDFTGFLTDVGYNGTHTGNDPNTVSRSFDGSVVGFDFSGQSLAAGSATNILLIETDATSYTTGTFTVQDGATVDGVGYAPTVASTPEPASLALFGTGLLGLVGVTRRKLHI